MSELKVLISKNELYKKIQDTADKINAFYGSEDVLNLVCVLKGAAMFACELMKYLDMPVKIEFVSLASYDATKSTGVLQTKHLDLPDFNNENVLIVEDIIDSGLTMDFLIRYIETHCSAKSIKLAVLLEKECEHKYDIKPDFCASKIDDKFIVGFGLDYNGIYRNLDYIASLESL